ncbi:MAG TPA: hypothetical protein VG293_05055 [Solirubrobacteraceae bacterium]|nr:hypothetical protein [Solirubrobacteraceae bacterium]
MGLVALKVDGIWPAVGAVGWGYLVCGLVGRFIAARIEHQGYDRPATGWMMVAVAMSRYGGMAVGHALRTHAFAAVVGGVIVIRLVAFNLDGSVRPWRWRMSGRWQLLAALMAASVGLSYSSLHSFAADGDDGTFASPPTASVTPTRSTSAWSTLRYTILGISTSETIPLQQPLVLTCGASSAPVPRVAAGR